MNPDAYNAKILQTLEQLQRDVSVIKQHIGASGERRQSNGGAASAANGEVADERDLDGQYGDPTIKYDPKPKYWSGESFAGFHFSETTPDYLDAMAKYLDACAYMASQDPDEKRRKNAAYKAKDAARARGWAKRLREGGPMPTARPPSGDGYTGATGVDDDIPF